MGRLSRRDWAVLTAVGTLTLILAAGKLFVAPSFLLLSWYRDLGFALHPTPAQLLPAALAVGLLFLHLRFLAGRRTAIFLLGSVVVATIIPVSLLSLTGNSLNQLLACTISPACTGGFYVGHRLTAVMLHDWPAQMASMRTIAPHISIGAPTWPLIFAGLGKALAGFEGLSSALAALVRPLQCQRWDFISLSDPQIASAWFGVASPLWAALTVAPLYQLGQNLFGVRAARNAVIWWATVPALSLFAGSLSTIYPLLATTIAVLVWRGSVTATSRRGSLSLVLGGSLTALMLLLSFSTLPLLMFYGVLAICEIWQQPAAGPTIRVRRLAYAGIAFVLAMLFVLSAYWALFGHSPWSLLRLALSIHLADSFPYLPGLAWHIWDFVLMAGAPACVLAVAYLLRPLSKPMTQLAVALGSTLAVLLFSGTATTEVGRVWLFFVPFVLLLAAAELEHMPAAGGRLCLVAQTVWLVALAMTYWPGNRDLQPTPVNAQFALPALAAPLMLADATFGDELRLTGYQSEFRPERGTLIVAIHWKVLKPVARPYYFSAILVAPGGDARPGVTWQPFANRYPTTCWQPSPGSRGEVVDQIELPLGNNYETGNWWLSVSAFAIQHDETMPPLVVSLPDGSRDKQTGLGPLPVAGR